MDNQRLAGTLAESHQNWKPKQALLPGVLSSAAITLWIWLCYLVGSHIPDKKDNTSQFVHMTTLTALSMNMLIFPTVSYIVGLYKKRNLATPETVLSDLDRVNKMTQYTQFILFVAVSLGSIPLTEKFSIAPANETVSFDDGAARWGIGCGVLSAGAFAVNCCLRSAIVACIACRNEPVTNDENTHLNPTFNQL